MDILSRPVLSPDHRIHYGPDASQFGDLWIPAAGNKSPLPLVIFFHGGWWKSEYDLGHAGYLCRALKDAGIATWSVEYRRVGGTGGGWPQTFQDAAAGTDFVADLATKWPLDLTRVITMGHSAGGHLAFWVAGRHHLDPHSEIYQPPRVSMRGTIALAGAVDLRMTIDLAGESIFAHDKQEVYALMGGRPAQFPDRYAASNPGDLLPFHVPQILIQGTDDDQIPPMLPTQWVELSRRTGDTASVKMIPGADHLDLIDPERSAWMIVLDCVRGTIRV